MFRFIPVVGRVLLFAGLLQVSATCALCSQILSVSLNTSALTTSTDTFALDFQLIAGGGTWNQIQATSFDFGGGSYDVSMASSIGGATVTDGPLTIGLDDTSNFFNEVVLPLVPGNSLRFLLSITNQLSIAPDSFTLAVLDNGNEIPTTNPIDAFVEVDFSPGGPTAQAANSDPYATPIDVTASVGPANAPEPSPFVLCALGALLLCGRFLIAPRRLRPSPRLRWFAMATVIAVAALSPARAFAQYNISTAVSPSTPKPGGGTFNPVMNTGVGASLDGNNLVFSDYSNTIWAKDISTNQFRELVGAGSTVPGYGTIFGVGVSPLVKNGMLAFVGLDASSREGIYTLSLNGGTVSKIADNNTPTPDNRGNFFVNYSRGSEENSTYRISLDGSHIAFDTASSNPEAYVANIDGSGLAPLVSGTQGLLCFLFNPYIYTRPAIWGTHFAFDAGNSFGANWFFTATYPPGIASPPVPACSPNGPLNYPATVAANAILPGNVTAGGDNSPFTPVIDNTQLYFYAQGSPGGLYSANYDGTNIQGIVEPSIALPNFAAPYSILSFSADSGSIAFAVSSPTDGEAIFVYCNGHYHRVVGSGDVIGGNAVPFSPSRLSLGEYALSGGNLTFQFFNTAHYLATPNYCADDMTFAASVTSGGARYDHASGQFLQTVTVKNTSSQAIAGPVSLVLKNLTTGVTVSNPAGVTSCSTVGNPYVVLNNGGGLAPGASTTVTIAFHDPSFAAIGYTSAVLSGVQR
jgi:hypothetical protein